MKPVFLALACLFLSAAPTVTSRPVRAHSHGRHAQTPGSSQTSTLSYDAAVAYDSGGSGGRSAAVADVNGDGKPDLLVASRCGAGDPACNESGTQGQVGVMLGNGDGTFQNAVLYDSGAYEARAIVIADVNGDGKLDAVVTHLCAGYDSCGNGAVSVLLGNGNGTFQTAHVSDAGVPQSFFLALADVNGDGKVDAMVADRIAATSGAPAQVSVMLGNGDGTFQTGVTYSGGGIQTYSLAVADFNGDGKTDIAVANYCAHASPNCNVAGGGSVGVLLGVGDGTFQTAVSYGSGGAFSYAIAAADINHDGKVDLVAANQCTSGGCNTGAIGVLLGKGDGTFQTVVSYTAIGSETDGINIADVNGDGNPDVLVSNYCVDAEADCVNTTDGGVDIFVGNGDGTFQSPVALDSGAPQAYAVTTADLNGDSLPDILVTNQYSATASDGIVGVLLAQNFSVGATVLSPPSFNAGSSATATVQLSPSNGFQHSVTLSCVVTAATGAGTPAPACSLAPSSITGASGTSTLTVSTVGASGALRRPSNIFYAACLPLLGLFGVWQGAHGSRFSKVARFLFVGMILAGLLLMPACSMGNNNGGGGGGGGCASCTAPGIYAVTVVGTDATNSNIKESLPQPLTFTVN